MRSILIIEDEKAVRNGYKRFFKINYPQDLYAEAEDAHKAIELLRGVQFALVLCDFDLKLGTTGADVLKWIEEHQPNTVQRFIFLSGGHMEEIEALHHLYLEKPFSMDDLRKMIDNIFAADSQR